jgi:UDP-GlcNAc3NAcA epimerase
MIRLLTIVGARPQFIKAAAISRAIRQRFSHQISEIILHTGQHYDATMSEVFFTELDLPKENYNLRAGSGSHGEQTAAILIGIEKVLVEEKPECILLYGDTNSTLAGAIAASKLHIPIVHIEGGVRSYNKKFPEEVNRLICDHLSTMIFVPTKSGIDGLRKEGFNLESQPPYTADNPKVYYCGDIMYDNSLLFAPIALKKSRITEQLGIKGKRFGLVTIHRPNNVDDERILLNLLATFSRLASDHEIYLIIPLHPRTMKVIEESVHKEFINALYENEFLKFIAPLSFIDITALELNAEIVMTDSGGVQKEAYYFKKPCVILMDETAWVELEQSGTAILTGADERKIMEAFSVLLHKKDMLLYPEIFGDGKAAEFICQKMIENFDRKE